METFSSPTNDLQPVAEIFQNVNKCKPTCEPYPLDVDEVMLGVPDACLFAAFVAFFRTFFVTIFALLVELLIDG